MCVWEEREDVKNEREEKEEEARSKGGEGGKKKRKPKRRHIERHQTERRDNTSHIPQLKQTPLPVRLSFSPRKHNLQRETWSEREKRNHLLRVDDPPSRVVPPPPAQHERRKKVFFLFRVTAINVLWSSFTYASQVFEYTTKFIITRVLSPKTLPYRLLPSADLARRRPPRVPGEAASPHHGWALW